MALFRPSPNSRRWLRSPAVLAVLSLVAVMTAMTGAARASAAVTVSASVAPTGTEFATSSWSDPWDFSNHNDALLDDGGPAYALAGQKISGGVLSFSMSRPGYFSPLWSGYPGSLKLGRDGSLYQNQINAATFNHISFRMYASQAVPGGVFWFTC